MYFGTPVGRSYCHCLERASRVLHVITGFPRASRPHSSRFFRYARSLVTAKVTPSVITILFLLATFFPSPSPSFPSTTQRDNEEESDRYCSYKVHGHRDDWFACRGLWRDVHTSTCNNLSSLPIVHDQMITQRVGQFFSPSSIRAATFITHISVVSSPPSSSSIPPPSQEPTILSTPCNNLLPSP